MYRIFTATFFIALLSHSLSSQYTTSSTSYVGPPTEKQIRIPAKHSNKKKSIIGNASIEITYGSLFTATQKSAFEYAAQIWETTLSSDVPVKVHVRMQTYPANVLGTAISSLYKPTGGMPFDSTYYSLSLANRIKGYNLASNSADTISFNSVRDWYYGTDAMTPSDKHDFVTVAIHELGHILGFGGALNGAGTSIYVSDNEPSVWSHFVELGDGTPILDYAAGSSQLISALVSDDLFFNGDFTSAATGGGKAKLYAPDPVVESSYDHLDQSDEVFVMRPQLGAGTAIHVISDMEIGIYHDLGWRLPGIYVSEPRRNSRNDQGDKIGIRWIAETLSGNVALSLFDNNGLVWQFTPNTANDGFHEVTIPQSIDSGTAYRVEVKSTGDPSIKNYSESFIIGSPGGNLVGAVIIPSATTVWQQGDQVEYIWAFTGFDGNIRVELHNDGALVHTHTTNTKNDGNHRFKLPQSLENSDNYVVKFCPVNSALCLPSSPFTIERPGVDNPTISFTAPNADDGTPQFMPGENVDITWSDNIPLSLILSLYEQGSGTPILISNNVPANASSYSYTLPSNLSDGMYKFRLVWNVNGVTQIGVNSDLFLIGDLPENIVSLDQLSLARSQSNDSFYEVVKSPEGGIMLLEGDYTNSRIELLDGFHNVLSTFNNESNQIPISIKGMPTNEYHLKISNLQSPHQSLLVNFN